ncbi:hypothetical protein [Deinococcus koreensis]|uniref:Uncharacterized protein n=1 Tax=Deinococcus koreensis TaxID=2054903 RepID=A0A2K3UWH8_9DEIO|nr:hypothetical protein [Deinococcus koreensis]PNY80871.1 hypothetical protein CVO96_05355 [Deinococcus koreensis]
MAAHADTCLLTQTQLLDLSFMEHRAHLLAIAAFLDRLERAQGAAGAPQDFRLEALRSALHELTSPEPGRVVRAQMRLSDQNLELLDLRDSQSAFGASRRPHEQQEAEQ